MPALYVDVHVGTTAMRLLAERGASIDLQVHGFHEIQQDASDPVQLAYAAQQQWTILTRDEDFRHLHELWYVVQAWRPLDPPQRHAGIIWVDVKSGRMADDDMALAVADFLTKGPDVADTLFVLSRKQGRVSWERYFPFRRQRREVISQ